VNIQTLLRPILTEMPTGKRYRLKSSSWQYIDYLVVPTNVSIKPYCVNYEGKQEPWWWNRNDIAILIKNHNIEEVI